MAQDLQTITPANRLAQWSAPELPAKLATLVDSELPDKLPPLSEIEIAGLKGALAAYDAHPKGSTGRQINKMLTKLSLAYPNVKLSDEEAEARMELYEENLGDIDVDILAEGFRAAVRKSRFFPSVSELRGFAMEQPATPRLIRQHRIRMLLARYRDQEGQPAEPYVTPAQIAAIKAEVNLGADRDAA